MLINRKSNNLCGRPPQYALASHVTLTFDLESGVRVTCDVGYVCANFNLPRPLSSRLRPDVRDRRQTSDRRQTASSLKPPRGHNKHSKHSGHHYQAQWRRWISHLRAKPLLLAFPSPTLVFHTPFLPLSPSSSPFSIHCPFSFPPSPSPSFESS